MAPRGPAHAQLESLDSVFGKEYFEQGRLVITVARDLPGVMKVAHRLQKLAHENFGAMVEVIMEHVKHAWWMKLHEATTTMGLKKEVDRDPEAATAGVTDIPEGIRVHPYKRDHLPTLEVLLLWEDKAGGTRGHCLSSTEYPDVPTEVDIDRIFGQIEPFFAKRWIFVDLKLAAPVRGEFDEEDAAAAQRAPHDDHVGAGAHVEVLACHALGFAREPRDAPVAHVSECAPMVFQGVSDDAGRVKICFLPADINKLQIAETDAYQGKEVNVLKTQLNTVDLGPTVVTVELTPKALAGLTVHVFAMPKVPPVAEDGIIDWACEAREALPDATVDVTPLLDGASTLAAKPSVGSGTWELNGLPEGCITLTVNCPGYTAEERTVMLLVGSNEFYVPLMKA